MATEEKTDLSGLSIRLAVADNKSEVMAMSEDVYCGMDYLPAFYDNWIVEAEQKHPRRFNFVAVLEDQIVAFFSLLFLSEKTCMIESAERVHPRFRGQGIAKKMAEFKTSFVKSLTPTCSKIASFTDNWTKDDSLARLKDLKGEELLKRSVTVIKFNAKSWINHRKDSTQEVSNFQKVGGEFLENILEDGFWRSLVPSGVLHVNWDPYIPGNKEDIKYIASKDLVIIKDQQSFSIFHNPFPIPAGFRGGLDIFCSTFDKFVSHILYQLDQFAKSADEEEMKLFIFTPLEWTEDLLVFLKGSCKMEDNIIQLGGMEYRPWPTMFVYRKMI